MLNKKKVIVIFLLIFILISSLYGALKPLPKGVSVEGKSQGLDSIKFLRDLTYEKEGQIVHDRQIFNNVYRIIDEANNFIILDMFLFNDDYDKKDTDTYPKLTSDLTQKLVNKKKSNPGVKIYFITDKINTGYGSYPSKYLEEMKKNNIEVIVTNLSVLRDSNYLYSGIWRGIFQWFNIPSKGLLPNPFGSQAPKFRLYSYFDLLNFKANHRKVICTENEALVSSGNPHEPSGNHSNIAFAVKGEIVNDLIESEKVVASFSGGNIAVNGYVSQNKSTNDVISMLITEGKIKAHLLKEIKNSDSDDVIEIGVFYLAERDLINELKAAAKRGAKIKLILDMNKDAFGRKKNGVPNTEVAKELLSKNNGNIEVRWYNTHGEQYHSKIAIFNRKAETVVIGGSANFTKRNIGDYNLETDIKIAAPNDSQVIKDVLSYFDMIWNNKNGNYTIDYKEYKKSSFLKTVLYRIQEITGFSSF